jgi:hypothetical protein
MRQVHESDLLAELAFAKRAAEKFAAEPKTSSFSDADITRGEFLALRWGLGDDCVLVLKLDEIHTPTIYAQQVRLAASTTTPEIQR